jgi:hypothetical protein
MPRHTLVVRRNGELSQPREVLRLLERLAEQPGVESVRVEATPLRVVLRVVPELADESALRALVHAQQVELESRVASQLPTARAGRSRSVPPPARLRLATSAAPLR